MTSYDNPRNKTKAADRELVRDRMYLECLTGDKRQVGIIGLE